MAVNAFLAAGMNPNVKDESRGETALIAAATRGDMAIVKTLIDGGADINAKATNGANALIRALENKHEDISALLLTKPNLDLNTQRAGRHHRADDLCGSEKNLRCAATRKGRPRQLQDAEGDTALHRASQSGSLKIVQMLLDKSPIRIIKIGRRQTSDVGSAFGHHELQNFFWRAGRNSRLKTRWMTASAWATKNNNPT